MPYCVDGRAGSPARDERWFETVLPQKLAGGIALALFALASGWTLYANLAGTHPDLAVTAPTITVLAARPERAANAQPEAPAEPGLLVAPVVDVALFHATYSLGLPPVRFSLRPSPAATPAAQVHVVAIPLPRPRPAAPALAERLPENPFEKLFGKSQATGAALGYAAADGGVFSNGRGIPRDLQPPNDGLTAIYDITARTVYMPDGTKLEAHSGLGPKMDDPRYVDVKMHGATPPHVYDLAPREAPFHGVEALRMHPVGGSEAIFGRAGLLTHTYLLGPNGDSNGCVSFKDYDTFLRAYKDGKVRRMIVVASLDDPQLDLRLVERPPAKVARAYVSRPETTFSRIDDDRYALPLSASRASRTSSSARSL